ncbi:MAG: Ig-like domain-containing protein, partial [Acidimicrobiia bacterium]|nr:Ig-like domain-containing protein [Acidimicrobiia bacterium]
YGLAGWATLISMGPANESGQNPTFVVTSNSNPGLFATLPKVKNDGKLEFDPANDAFGSAVIDVVLKDDGGFANPGDDDTSATYTFTITVDPVNDEPDFSKGSDVTVGEDSGAYVEPAWATSIDPGMPNESAQILTFVIDTNSNPGLFAAGPAVDSSGTLTFTPTANASGSADIDLYMMDDGGILNGGDDRSPTRSFKIAVTAVNDDPVASDDSYPLAVAEGGSFSTTVGTDGVAENDTDAEDGTPPLGNATLVTPPAYSSAFVFNLNGSFTYTHDGSENFVDSFTYTVDDSGGATSNVATATITISPTNDPPVAVDDDGLGTVWEPYFHLPLGNPPTLIPAAAFLGNDSDPDGDPITIVVSAGATTGGGFVSCGAVGCTYAPPLAKVTDTFTYQISDGTLTSAAATVTIDVEDTSAGLVLTPISALPDPVAVLGNVTFVTRVDNLGFDETGGVVLRGDYPAGTSFFSAGSTKGGCADLGSRVECTIGAMIAGTFETVTVVLTVDSGPGPLSFTEWVTTDNSGDPIPSTNYVTHLVGIA